jgi:hypothetical protein
MSSSAGAGSVAQSCGSADASLGASAATAAGALLLQENPQLQPVQPASTAAADGIDLGTVLVQLEQQQQQQQQQQQPAAGPDEGAKLTAAAASPLSMPQNL